MRLPIPFPPPAPRQLLQGFPLLLARTAAKVPFVAQQQILKLALARIFEDAVQDGDFDFLQDKFIRVEITDADLCWYFSFAGGKIQIMRHAEADAVIRGELNEFILLAGREEDPDTLFFQRRLIIEGDTEISLELKNVLDTLDTDSLPVPLQWALDRVSSLAKPDKAD